jgi:hypothetical protein
MQICGASLRNSFSSVFKNIVENSNAPVANVSLFAASVGRACNQLVYRVRDSLAKGADGFRFLCLSDAYAEAFEHKIS